VKPLLNIAKAQKCITLYISKIKIKPVKCILKINKPGSILMSCYPW